MAKAGYGRNRKFDILQILIMAGLLAFMIIMLTAGNSKVVPMTQIRDAMLLDPGVSELSEKTMKEAAKTFSLNADQIQEGIYFRVDDIMNVNELLILRIPDDDLREAAVSSITRYLEEKKAAFNGYGTNQYGLLSQAVITEKGEYVFFGVSEDVLRWETEFLNCVT